MRYIVCIVLMIIGTIFIGVCAYSLTGKANAVAQREVGPHQTIYLTDSYIYTLDGTYTLKSANYFELIQGGDVRQSVYHEPEVGQEKGDYRLTDDLTGDWRIDGFATMYSRTNNTFTATHTTGDKVMNGFLIGLVALLVWALFMNAVSYFMDL